MLNIKDTLQRLATTFNARDIMVPKAKLIRAKDAITAKILFEQYPAFDVIPISQSGMLSAYIERGINQVRPIRLQNVVSDTTSILDIVDILKKRSFCFVLAKQDISGYIHFSDLNNRIVKLPYFLIFEALEEKMVEKIKSEDLVINNNLNKILGEKRTKEIKKRMRRMEKNRSDLKLMNLLSFNEIVRIANHLKKVKLKQKQIDILSKVRNLVCHADRPFVEKHNDVKRISEAKRICILLLEN